jgi:hypothetical protein
MTYTINGKEYTEFDINYRCAVLMGSKLIKAHPSAKLLPSLRTSVITDLGKRDYCNDPSDTDAIIDKCWDELMKLTETFDDGIADGLCTRWEYLMDYVKCTKLVAACICYVKINEGKL